MTTLSKSRLIFAIGVPALIFIACTLIVLTTNLNEHSEKLSLAIISDLLISAPVAYFLVIRKTLISKLTVLRVLLIGIFLASVLLPSKNTYLLMVVKTWLSPLLELTLIGFVVLKFHKASKVVMATNQQQPDFTVHCRAILQSVLGSERWANVLTAELSVFYYAFSKRNKNIDSETKFTCYKENGIILVLNTFLVLFAVETVGMHFLFLLWNKTAAWIITSVSFYTCLQLFAHIKALKSRPVIILNNTVRLANGILGGEVTISLDNIEKIEITNKPKLTANVTKLAFIKGLENHNIAIYLCQQVTVIKAFGIKKNASILLVNIDKPKAFIETLKSLGIKTL